MKLTLYHYWRSSASWRVRWALALKHVPVEFVAVNLLAGEQKSEQHRSRNPMGQVPALHVVDDAGQTHWLGESTAIIEWLDETYPQHPLLPGNPFERAQIRQLAQIINAGTAPLQNMEPRERVSSDPAVQKNWAQHFIRKGLTAYETLVATTTTKFSVTNEPTLADLCLIPQCYNALRNDIPLTEFPRIHSIYTHALTTKACQESAPDRFEVK